MDIRQKVTALIILAGIAIYLAPHLLFTVLITDLDDKTKISESDNDLYMLDLSMSEITEQLEKNVRDWANWDDTYGYVNSPNQQYIDDNINNITFENLEINGIIITDRYRKAIFESYYDLGTHKFVNYTETDKSSIYDMINHQTGESSIGVINTSDSLIFYAGNRVYTTDKQDNSGAYIYMVRRLDEKISGKIKKHLIYPSTIEVTSVPIEEKYPEAIEIAENTYRTDMEARHFITYTHIYDYNENIIGIVKIDTNWNNYERAEISRDIMIIGLIISTTIICIAFYYFSAKYLIFRLKKIDSTISDIIRTKNLRKKVEDNGKDEIGNLARNFNLMIGKINEKETEIIQKNRELEVKNKNLQKIDEMKDEIMSSVSHELRTPLTGIRSYVQLMKMETLGPVTEEQKEALETVENCSDDLNKIVSDILDIKKYESGMVKMSFSKCDFKDHISHILGEFSATMTEIGGKIVINDTTKTHFMYVDCMKMNEVMRNLISNAIKYRGDKSLIITIDISEDDNYMVMSISDNGIGIEEGNIRNIFQKFYQVDQKMNRKVGGSGLGLYLVKKIIEAHNGTISVESKPGMGTRFIIRLPKPENNTPGHTPA